MEIKIYQAFMLLVNFNYEFYVKDKERCWPGIRNAVNVTINLESGVN